MKRRTHPDGSICQEGIRSVRRGKQACCDEFYYRTATCIYDIRYQWYNKHKTWGVPLCDGGTTICVDPITVEIPLLDLEDEAWAEQSKKTLKEWAKENPY